MKKSIPNTEALKIIEESIKAGNSVRLAVRGSSMSPRLLDGTDIVTLHPFAPENLKSGDVILFRYRGAFLLHRIIGIKSSNSPDGIITTKGDALDQTEIIGYSDVVALAELPEIGLLKLTGRRVRILLSRMGIRIKRYLNINHITINNETNT